jgi:hypothetical protein
MILNKLALAKCFNRTEKSRTNDKYGSPDDWFSNQHLMNHNLKSVSFDFFVNWGFKNPEITKTAWIKKILNKNYSIYSIINNIKDILIEELTEDYISLLQNFSLKNNINIEILIFNDENDWGDKNSKLLLVNIVDFECQIVNIETFKMIIRDYSGGPVKIGSKGLKYGTSNLECHLSTTNSLYPGDVDLLIIDNEYNVKCILEFKKHTLDTGINEQKLSNYYPSLDSRKYHRLVILRNYFNPSIPLIVIYYPTSNLINMGKMELLKGDISTLETNISSNFDIPNIITNENIDNVILKLNKAINYHNSLI